MKKTRREIANEAMDYIGDYLRDAGWAIDFATMFHIDPITQSKYSADTAFVIQLGRDI